MTFSSQVKNELIKNEYENACCKKSLLYGMCLFGKSFSSRYIALQTENELTAKLYCDLLKELCNIDTEVIVSPSGKSYTVNIEDSKLCSKIMGFFGHSANEPSIKINVNNFSCEDCTKAFIAGAFLSCGTVSDPEKDYHLEFTVTYLNLSKSFMTLLNEMDLSPKYSNRKKYFHHVIYFKDRESIEDCLYIMGASSCMFDMMNVEIIKDIRNSANRKANCETANIEKMVKAAYPQIAAIEKIIDKKGIEWLPQQLQDMANIRLENPDSSLSELAEMFEPPISKSGVNHRLKKLVKIAEEL